MGNHAFPVFLHARAHETEGNGPRGCDEKRVIVIKTPDIAICALICGSGSPLIPILGRNGKEAEKLRKLS